MRVIKDYKFLVLAFIFVLLINISLIFNNNVWCDEAFIINACRLDFSSLLAYIASNDMRPPLYLLSVKIWSMFFGDSVWGFKIFSIIPCALGMLINGRIICKNWEKKSALIFILLAGISPSGMTKNIEVTIYSWTAFWVTLSLLSAYEVYKDFSSLKKVLIFIIASLGAASTHYYALVAVGVIYLGLFICILKCDLSWKVIKKIVCILVVSFVGYIPVLPFFYQQFKSASSSFWILGADLSIFPNSMRVLFEGDNTFKFTNEFTMLAWIFIFYCMITLIVKLKDCLKGPEIIDIKFALLCLLLCALLPSSGYIISKIVRPLYNERYFFCVSGVIWVFIAICISVLQLKRSIYHTVLATIIVMFLFDYPVIHQREYNSETANTVTLINDNLNESDIFVNNIELCASWEIEYYFPNHEYYLNHDEGIYYKDESFDFSSLDTAAIYICQGNLDISDVDLKEWNLDCTYLGDGNFDNYYYFSIYKIQPRQQRGNSL